MLRHLSKELNLIEAGKQLNFTVLTYNQSHFVSLCYKYAEPAWKNNIYEAVTGIK